LRRTPLARVGDAKRHTLFDTTEDLPLFRYLRDAPGGIDSLAFNRVVRLGTIAAIRQQVLLGKGVAVLPEYFVSKDLRGHQLVRLLPRLRLLSDFFRLVFRADDPRRSLFMRLGEQMRAESLQ
jgi:DNA-binding transcriptional LysR family regulator